MWIIFVILFIIFNVINTQLYKVVTRNEVSDGGSLICILGISILTVLCFIPFFEFKLPINIYSIILLIVSGLLFTIADRIGIYTRRRLQVSTFSILNQFSSVVMIVIGILIFKEGFGFTKLFASILIILSNVLVVYEKNKKPRRAVILLLLARTAYAVAIAIDIQNIKNFNIPIYIALTYLIPILCISTFDKIKDKDLKNELTKQNIFPIIFTGITTGLSIMSMYLAYQTQKATIVAPILSSVLIINVIYGIIFLKERKKIRRKIIASIGATIGLIILNI